MKSQTKYVLLGMGLLAALLWYGVRCYEVGFENGKRQGEISAMELSPEIVELWEELGIDGVSLGYWEFDETPRGCAVFVDLKDGEDICVKEFDIDGPPLSGFSLKYHSKIKEP